MARPASDGAAEDSLKGKEITLLVGSTPGGPYDAYARMVARHMGHHIPGGPSFVVVNMPGASGRKLMGYVYNSAPKDGTTIALAQRALAFDPLMGVAAPAFDANGVSWIGSANTEVNVCMVWHTSRSRPSRTLRQCRWWSAAAGRPRPIQFIRT